jgi:hypothetical protein
MGTQHRDWLFGLLAVGIGSFAASLPGQADDRVLVEEAHAAREMRVSAFAGNLTVEGHERTDIRLELRGSAAALERLRREVRGDRLEVAAAPGPDGVTTVTSGRNNVVIAASDARATQIIGGEVTTAGGAAEPALEVHAYLPQGAPLIVEGMVGELTVAGVDGPVELELAGGSARLDRVAGGRLAVVGGSRIEAGAARGDLALEVQGAGDVVVDHAALERLEVAIDGAGDVEVRGSARQARVTVAGVGDVRIDEVRERPEVEITGIGDVAIGNW